MIAISFSGENRVLVKNLDPGAPEKAFSTDPDEVSTRLGRTCLQRKMITSRLE